MASTTHLLFLSLSSLFLLYSASAVCVPRNATAPIPYTPIAPQPPSPAVAPPSGDADTDIKEICNQTDNPDLCITSIHSYLFGTTTVDAATALDMEIQACTNYTNGALYVAGNILKLPTTTRMVSENIQVCVDSYKDALDNLQSASNAAKAHDIGTLNSMLSAALTDYGTCEDGFTELPGVDSPMSSYDQTLSKLASNCLAIAELLK